jgi:antitoxin (DNA-binding transcriptional repressor) of toxin-antitoxin stability system
MFHMYHMETVTIRELRQNWPGIERRLKATRAALLVTRDGTPVAQVSPPPAEATGPQVGFSAVAHRQWRAKHWRGPVPRTNSGHWLTRTREELRMPDSP